MILQLTFHYHNAYCLKIKSLMPWTTRIYNTDVNSPSVYTIKDRFYSTYVKILRKKCSFSVSSFVLH